MTVYLLGDHLGVVVRAGGSGVILAARLKIYLLVFPTHSPVDLPTELAVVVFKEIELALVTATAGKGRLGAVVGKGRDLCKVGVALGAENADGVVVRLLRVVSRRSFFLAERLVLCFEGVEYLKDLASFLERKQKIGRIFATSVHICLISALELNSKWLYSIEELLFKVTRVVFVASERVGNVNVGTTDIFIVRVTNHRLNICGDLAATVKFIPGNDELCFFASFFKRLYDEQGGRYIAEISYVYRSRGRHACRTDVFLLIGILLYQPIGYFF